MNEQSATATDRRTAEWLQDGPSAAPGYLLDATLERTGRTVQRPRVIALILGAPRGGLRPEPAQLRLILLAGLVTLMIVAGALIAGALRRDDRLTVAPSTSPLPSGEPSRAPAPSPSGPPGPIVVEPQFESPTLGFAFLPGASGQSFQAPRGSDDAVPNEVHFLKTTCSFCIYDVTVTSGPANDGVLIAGKRIKGGSLGILKDSWTAMFGQTAFTREVVGGEIGSLAEADGTMAILMVHAGRDFALFGTITMSPFGPHGPTRDVLEEFGRGFSFLDAPTAAHGRPEEFTIPGALPGRFKATPSRAGGAVLGPDFVEVPAAEGVTTRFDPVTEAWAVVHVQEGAMILASNAVIAERRAVRRVEIQVGADHGVLLLSGPGRADPPVAIIGHGDRAYRIDIVIPNEARLLTTAPTAEQILRQFLITFQALDISGS